MKHISVLVKPASSLCNIRCKYCFYADVSSLREVKSFGKMTPETGEKMIDNLFVDLEDGDELSIVFQGGEPTLAGLDYFKNIVFFVNKQKKRVKVHYTLQTNGMVINQRWCTFLKENDFLVGLSIDGHPIYHDLNRVSAKGRGTFYRVLETKKLFDEYEIEYNILCVLTNPLAKEAKDVFRFLKDEQIQYIQFIPCLDDFDATKKSSYALTPKRFASFYHQILKYWLEELRSGHYISIQLFDNIVNLLVYNQSVTCGTTGKCELQYVIEGNGNVYPCDFYVLDEYYMGNIQEETPTEMLEKETSCQFLCSRKKLYDECDTCPFLSVCGGGCKRMKDAMFVDGSGFCGYQALLREFIPKIDEILTLVNKL